MTMQLDDETLQRYYDGELSPVEERAVRARVESSPEAQKQLAELARLSELFRMAADEMGSEVDSAALFAGIESDLKKEPSLGALGRLRLVRDEWLEHRRGVVVTLVGATAVAAAALLTVLGPRASDGDEELQHVAQNTPAPTAAPSAAPEAEGTARVSGSRVENVDFGKSTGTVFEIESQGVTTAVVWIADDDSDKESAP
jgi:anti-sigma factor RsiW